MRVTARMRAFGAELRALLLSRCGTTLTEMEFAYLVRPAFDQRFLARATEQQRAVVEEHGAWLEARYAEGRVRFAGRCYDGPFGLVVLDVDSDEEAQKLMEADPSVRSGVQSAELYPFRTFLALGDAQRPLDA